jgi:hypothetical protein
VDPPLPELPELPEDPPVMMTLPLVFCSELGSLL